jgi:hypothetical protein
MAALVFSLGGNPSIEAAERSHGCLYGVTVGNDATPVDPCIDADPFNIGHNANVQKVLHALGIDARIVRFKGCKNQRFSAAPDWAAIAAERRYIVTYPTESDRNYLAPITHELAHVLQMEMEGGLSELRQKYSSKRVELGADYLAGLIFSQVLRDTDINQFQHNLSLIGLYVELDADAHGTPSQRVGAFRLGYINFDAVEPDMRKASRNFQANYYGHVIQF